LSSESSQVTHLFTTQQARDGVEACNKAFENNYDLILMDVQMPIMGGMEATQKIREFAPVV